MPTAAADTTTLQIRTSPSLPLNCFPDISETYFYAVQLQSPLLLAILFLSPLNTLYYLFFILNVCLFYLITSFPFYVSISTRFRASPSSQQKIISCSFFGFRFCYLLSLRGQCVIDRRRVPNESSNHSPVGPEHHITSQCKNLETQHRGCPPQQSVQILSLWLAPRIVALRRQGRRLLVEYLRMLR